MLNNKIATWIAAYKSPIDTRISCYTGFGPPDISDASIGAVYFDTDANKTWIFNPKTQWAQMANYDECKTAVAKDNKKIINCRNCGAPVRSHVCEYCGTRY